MKARCAHGAPWFRNDCPRCSAKWEPLDRYPVRESSGWWGWDDGFGNVMCGPCGAQLQPGVPHRCPGARP